LSVVVVSCPIQALPSGKFDGIFSHFDTAELRSVKDGQTERPQHIKIHLQSITQQNTVKQVKSCHPSPTGYCCPTPADGSKHW